MLKMADSKLLLSPRSESSSPPPHCAICLGSCSDKCFSNSCMHQFCFRCLLEWSKIKAECPLCKQPFKSIIHNIKTNEEYDEYLVQENIIVEDNSHLDSSGLVLPNAPPVSHHHQYHFRTTFTVDTHGEHAIQQMLLSHPLLSLIGLANRYTHHRRRRSDTSTSFRRSIYSQNLWVYSPPDLTARYRDVSPYFYRNNPAARTRLVPWLNRELNALLHENTQQVMNLVDIIMDHLMRHHICSHVFRTLLSNYLGVKTDHFVHEFYSFMRSPYDMVGYDRHVIYTERPTSPTPYIDVSDYDSDVIIVSNTNNSNNSTSQQTPAVVINLVDSDSDEPIVVSEERVVIHDSSSSTATSPNEGRKPVLPLKLRFKNSRRSRERREARSRKRAHGFFRGFTTSTSTSPFPPTFRSSSSSSSSSSSTSSSTSSSSSSSSRSRDYHRRKFKRKRSIVSRKRRRLQSSSNSDNDVIEVKNESSDEDNLPLSNFKAMQRPKLIINGDNNVYHRISKVEVDRLTPQTPPLPPADSDLDDDDDNYRRPNFVRSKICPVIKKEELPGPSKARLMDDLRMQERSNLWYSRPGPSYDSESSDN